MQKCVNIPRPAPLFFYGMLCLPLAVVPGYAAPSNTSGNHITLPPGTQIPVRLGQSLDTKRDAPGTPFVAHLSAPVTRNGEVVLERGAVCRGHVVESRSSGRLKGRGLIRLSLDSIESHGRIYTISTADPAYVSKRHKKRNLTLIGGGTGTGAAIGAIAGGGFGALVGAGAGAVAGTTTAFITGKKNVHLAAETRLTFALKAPLSVPVAVQTSQR